MRFRHQSAGKNTRYVAWAIFRSKRTGRQFFFANTHLDPYSISVRKAQWSELIANIDRLNRSRPVVAVGDFNSSTLDSYTRTFLPAMRRHGYGDAVNQSYRHPLASPRRAESSSRGWVNSFNAFRRDIRRYAYEDSRRRVGNGIDWIFAVNRMLVRYWEVVTNIDPRTLRVRGVIPSDHTAWCGRPSLSGDVDRPVDRPFRRSVLEPRPKRRTRHTAFTHSARPMIRADAQTAPLSPGRFL